MATVTIEYSEGEAEGLPFDQTLYLSRDQVDDIYDMLDFLTVSLKAMGFDWVDRVGIQDEYGDQKWNTF